MHVDGAARGNPGPAAAAAVLYDEQGEEVWAEARLLGETTNNVAEYEALILGLEAAATRCRELSVAADSELVVRQLQGAYKIRQPHLVALAERVRELMGGFDSVEIDHIPRADNARADALANAALDGDEKRAARAAKGPPGEVERADATAEAGTGPGYGTDSAGYYELTVKGHFDAAHALRGYPGKCKDLHGHTWDIEVTVGGDRLDEVEILYDFGDLKRLLAETLDVLDHTNLNEVPPFDVLSPTGENLARHLYDALAGKLPQHVELVEVVVWESPVARLAYRPRR